MGGLSCYTMCTSPKHAAPAAQALRRGSVLTNAHRRQETVHRLGSNSKVPRVRKLLLPPPLRVSGGDSLLDFPRGLLCDELCFLSRTAIGPPPNVTLVDRDPILTDRPNSTSSTQRHLCNKTQQTVAWYLLLSKQTPVKGSSASDVGDHSCLGLEGLLREISLSG